MTDREIHVRGGRVKHPRLAAYILGIATVIGCRDRAPTGRGGAEQAPIDEPPFVVFAQSRLVIDRLGAEVAAPVTVGSTPSPVTMASDSPDVVEVTPDGRLLARREGRAQIRAASDPAQKLEVDVRPVAGLAISPDVVPLEPGDEVQLELREPGTRNRLDPAAAEWATTAPDVALVIAGRVETKGREGTAVVTARYGGRVASAKVVVSQRRGRGLAIRPQAPTLRVGEIVTFAAPEAAGAQRWNASAGSILFQSGAATFVAQAAGKTSVCVEAGARRGCTGVTVRR